MKRGLRRMKHFAALPQNMKRRLRAMKRSLAGFMFFVPFSPEKGHKKWWPDPESNWGHRDFQYAFFEEKIDKLLVDR